MEVEIDNLVIRVGFEPQQSKTTTGTPLEKESDVEWLVEQCLERLFEHLKDQQ